MPEATKVEAPKPAPTEKKNDKEEEKSDLVSLCGCFVSSLNSLFSLLSKLFLVVYFHTTLSNYYFFQSEEDKLLQEELNQLVEQLQNSQKDKYDNALSSLRNHISSATTSMTSVPKPLKFLRPHYDTLKEVYEKLVNKTQKELCSDILSVMAMTMGQKGECLKYRLTGNNIS